MFGQCDKCTANAKVRVTPPGGDGFTDLVFCQHHYNENENQFLFLNWKATYTIEVAPTGENQYV